MVSILFNIADNVPSWCVITWLFAYNHGGWLVDLQGCQVGTKVGQIGHKLDKSGTLQITFQFTAEPKFNWFVSYDANLTYSWPTSDISVNFVTWCRLCLNSFQHQGCQNILKLILKCHRFVPFEANLIQFRCQICHPCTTAPVTTGIWSLSISLCYYVMYFMTWWSYIYC